VLDREVGMAPAELWEKQAELGPCELVGGGDTLTSSVLEGFSALVDQLLPARLIRCLRPR
jgi:hypothetical protein